MAIKVKNYRIIPIKHLLKGNKIANSGDIVRGSSFINLQASLEAGICEETKESLSSSEDKKTASLNNQSNNNDPIDISSFSKKQLIAFAKENGYTLTSEVKKQGSEAIINSITEQSNTED